MRNFLILLGFVFLLVGCSSKTIIKEYSQETYEVLIVEDNSFDSLSDMQTKALNEAVDHCAREGKNYEFINQRIQPERTALDSQQVSLFFRCK